MIDFLHTDKKIKSNDSERVIDPIETVEMAKEKLASINCQYKVNEYNIDDTFYVSELFYENPFDMKLRIQPAGYINGGFSSMGKGTTPEQCLASMYMETIERISLWQHMNSFFPIYKGLNLRTGDLDNVCVDTSSSEMVAAGNTFEEAILHGLHEMMEVESIGAASINGSNKSITANLKPYEVIDFTEMYDWPDWVKSSFTVFRIPTLVKEFYTFIGLRYPIEQRFSEDYTYKKNQDGVYLKQPIKYTEWRGNKTAYAFTASGINPRKAISRCVQENFQGPDKYKYPGIKKEIPSHLNVVNGNTLISYETNSVNEDIEFIVSKIPERFNAWAIDLSSPELEVPVVKIVTDYHSPANVADKHISDMFYK